jgi:hypothetical protein
VTKHFVHTGISVLSYGYKAGRDLRWYLRRRLERA